MKAMSARERKLVAVAILLAVVALAWLGVIAPLASGFSERAERREELRARYAANERLISRIPRLRRAAEQIEARRAAFGIAAADAVQASDHLRERMEAALSASGGELRGSEVIEAEDGWARARVSGSVSNDQMVAWLSALTVSAPYLSIESLTIGADRAANSNELDRMDVQVEATIPILAAHQR